MATPVSRPSRGTSPAPSNIYATPPTPEPHNTMFDPSMFLFDNMVPDTASPPFQPAIPSPRVSQHSSAFTSPVIKQQSASPADTTHSQMSYNSNSPSNSFLDPRSSSSPSNYDIMSTGYSGSTTPGFDFDPLDELGLQIDTVAEPPPESESVPTSAVSSGYPPSPRLTVSPHPEGPSPSNGTSAQHSVNGLQSSPVVKVEYFTPEANSQQLSPDSHPASSSSTSSGIGADTITIRRGEDGSWSGGLDPDKRAIITNELPWSLKEQDLLREKEAKNAEVEDWLKKSTQLLPRKSTESRLRGGLAAPKQGRRRSKSVSDFRQSQTFVDGKPVGPGNAGDATAAPGMGSQVPGFAAEFEDDEDDEDDEDSSVDSNFNEGSLDEPLNEDVVMLDKEPAPSAEDLKRAEKEEEEAEMRRRETDEAFHPRPNQFFSKKAHPWNDIVGTVARGAAVGRHQPTTSNAAIMKFRRYADNIETASRVATFGSNTTKGTRRHSIGSDAEKVLGGPFKRLSFGRDKEKGHVARKASIWGNLRRTLSTNGGDKERDQSKEKEKEKEREREREKEKEKEKEKVRTPSMGSTLSPGVPMSRKRGHSFNSAISSSSSFSPFSPHSFKGSSLTLQTNVAGAFAHMASPLMAAGAGQSSASATSPNANKPQPVTPMSEVLSKIRRGRSKSELQKKHVLGMMSTLVGPALPMTSPVKKDDFSVQKSFTFGDETQRRGAAGAQKLLSPLDANRTEDDEDEDMDDDDVTSPFRSPGGTQISKPKLDIVPTLDGFAQNVRTLTPGLGSKLVDRIAHEQAKRFKKLVEHRQKHLRELKANGTCSNNSKCRKVIGAIGVGGDGVVSVSGHKRCASKGSFNGDGYDSSDDNDGDSEGNVAAAQFPQGVPTPPVSRLPAEFECPICFKVKKFNKPSDWTKHVHEDVQPFTCTFPECTEPKSFKRKADWVRHENERHRHLEWWTCTLPDCTHTCYRKDNFVQHLVREHKMAEPKIKKVKTQTGESGPTQEEIDKVWQIVDNCHQETDKNPNSEKCRFCGNACSTWKKLTVHLARHMEAISLPVLDLIRDDVVVPPSSRNNARKPAPGHIRGVSASHVPQSLSNPSTQHQPVAPRSVPVDPTTVGSGSRHLTPDGEYEPDDTMSQPYNHSLLTDGFLPSQQSPHNVPTYNLTPPQGTHSRSRSMPPHELNRYTTTAPQVANQYAMHQPSLSLSMAPSIPYAQQSVVQDGYSFPPNQPHAQAGYNGQPSIDTTMYQSQQMGSGYINYPQASGPPHEMSSGMNGAGPNYYVPTSGEELQHGYVQYLPSQMS